MDVLDALESSAGVSTLVIWICKNMMQHQMLLLCCFATQLYTFPGPQIHHPISPVALVVPNALSAACQRLLMTCFANTATASDAS